MKANKRKIEQLKAVINEIDKLKEIINCIDERNSNYCDGEWTCESCSFSSNMRVKEAYKEYEEKDLWITDDAPKWSLECDCELDKFLYLLLDELNEEEEYLI